jgi:NAD(P)-dependent dehydrogenase (short-subunit alcohol dehydrogenase family)
MARFDGKVALITGGTTGIGFSAARAFQAEGAQVIVTGRSEGALEAARAELGSRAWVVKSDTASLSELDALAAEVKNRFGHLDTLFVNAGIARFASLEESTPELFDEIFDINVRGAFFATQKLSPLLRSPGSIVLTTSVVDEKGFANSSIYSASKAALRSLARTFSTELLPKGIRVNAVSPGPIATPIFAKTGMDAAGMEAFERWAVELVPMKRLGRSEEVARAVLFLASEEASFINGEELAVDGGLSHV